MGHGKVFIYVYHPGVESRANVESVSHRCHLFEIAFVWELTKETIHLPLGCLQGGIHISVVYIYTSGKVYMYVGSGKVFSAPEFWF